MGDLFFLMREMTHLKLSDLEPRPPRPRWRYGEVPLAQNLEPDLLGRLGRLLPRPHFLCPPDNQSPRHIESK